MRQSGITAPAYSCGVIAPPTTYGRIIIAPCPAPALAGMCRHWFRKVLAAMTASLVFCPSAMTDAMAEERMQPVPCVWRVSMRGEVSQML